MSTTMVGTRTRLRRWRHLEHGCPLVDDIAGGLGTRCAHICLSATIKLEKLIIIVTCFLRSPSDLTTNTLIVNLVQLLQCDT